MMAYRTRIARTALAAAVAAAPGCKGEGDPDEVSSSSTGATAATKSSDGPTQPTTSPASGPEVATGPEGMTTGSGATEDIGATTSDTTGEPPQTSGSDTTGEDTGPPPMGGWQKAFQAGGAGVSCGMTYEEMVGSGAPSLTFGDSQIFVGFQQFGNNQDPVFRRFDAGVEVYCKYHEAQSPDGRAQGITWNGGPTAYVVYTVVGGGSEFDSAGKGSWVSSYGDGGASSKVTFLGEVAVDGGDLVRGTFVPAKKSMGTKTNTLIPVDAVDVLEGGVLGFKGDSSYSPLNPDRSPMCVGDGDYPNPPDGQDSPSVVAQFAPDFKSMLCATTWKCSAVKQPCP